MFSLVAGLIGSGDRREMAPWPRTIVQSAMINFTTRRERRLETAPLEPALLTEADGQVGRSDAW
jgi:hypothetical protein